MKPSSDPWMTTWNSWSTENGRGRFLNETVICKSTDFEPHVLDLKSPILTVCILPLNLKAAFRWWWIQSSHCVVGSSGKRAFGTGKFWKASLALERTQFDTGVPHTNDWSCKSNSICKNEPGKLEVWTPTQLRNIPTTLMHCQCVFVTSHLNKPITGFHQFSEMPKAAGEAHITTERLLSLLLFMIIIWWAKDNTVFYINS